MGSNLFLSLSCDTYGQKQLLLEIRLVAPCRRRWYGNGQVQGGACALCSLPSLILLPALRPCAGVGSTQPGSQCRAQAGLCLPLLQSWLHLGRLSLPQSMPMVSAPNTSSVTLLTSPALKIAAWTCSPCPPFLDFPHLPVGRSAPRDGVAPDKAW